MKRRLPLKLAVYEYACEMEGKMFTAENVLETLKATYGNESQLNINRINNYLSAFLGIKFLTEEKLEFDEQENLKIYYKLTDYGKTRKRFIPKH